MIQCLKQISCTFREHSLVIKFPNWRIVYFDISLVVTATEIVRKKLKLICENSRELFGKKIIRLDFYENVHAGDRELMCYT